MAGLNDRPWSAQDVERLKGWRASGVTLGQCARWLGRTVDAVSDVARRCGCRRPQDVARRARPLHERGMTPADIARRIGRNPRAVAQALRRVGLTPHATPPAERGRRGAARVLWKAKLSIGQLRRERERVAAVHEGWPPVTAGLVAYLDRFHRLGPATKAQDARRAGIGVPSVVNAVRRLVGGGWLVVVGHGPMKRPVYDLSPDVRARRDQTLAYRSEGVPA